MAGWSKFLEFFLRVTIKFARRICISRWPVYSAVVISSNLEATFTGCLLVIIRYKYRNGDKRYEGTFKQPFIYDNYAKAWLDRYPGGSEFPIKVSPDHPSCSIPVEGKIEFVKV
jgi:hypothetical protein